MRTDRHLTKLSLLLFAALLLFSLVSCNGKGEDTAAADPVLSDTPLPNEANTQKSTDTPKNSDTSDTSTETAKKPYIIPTPINQPLTKIQIEPHSTFEDASLVIVTFGEVIRSIGNIDHPAAAVELNKDSCELYLVEAKVEKVYSNTVEFWHSRFWPEKITEFTSMLIPEFYLPLIEKFQTALIIAAEQPYSLNYYEYSDYARFQEGYCVPTVLQRYYLQPYITETNELAPPFFLPIKDGKIYYPHDLGYDEFEEKDYKNSSALFGLIKNANEKGPKNIPDLDSGMEVSALEDYIGHFLCDH